MKKMKVAVFVTGQMRGDYKRYAQRMRETFPDADFFYTTWKGQPIDSLVTRYYDEPKVHWNPLNRTIARYITTYRRMLETNWNLDYLPPSMRDQSVERIMQDFHILFRDRNKCRHQVKQHYGYALAFRDFIQPEHDVAVRVRWDAVLSKDLKYVVNDFIEQVYEYKMPYGFHHYNENGIYGLIEPEKMVKLRKSQDVHDFMIIHRADMFDPNLALHKYKSKKLHIAEGGWWQILCEPYKVEHAEVKGYVRLAAQMKNDKFFYEEFLRDTNNTSLLYGNTELMRMMHGDVADYLSGQRDSAAWVRYQKNK